MNAFLVECVRGAGRILMNYWGAPVKAREKESQSSVVTEADWASERWLVDRIRRRFPKHGIVAEESGFLPGSSDHTWVIDPLDGTSNFAAGLPWFGVLLALLKGVRPVLGAMYLPAEDTVYLAEKGRGVQRNGAPVRMTRERNLRNVLCAYGLDASPDPRRTRQESEAMARLVNVVRNVRATNSLVDLCYTIDGRLGGFVNQATRIWDIAPACLMFPEAGGAITDLQGRKIVFDLAEGVCERSFAVVGASQALHPQLLRIVRAER